MIEREVEHFDVHHITPREWAQRIDYTKNMFFAAAAASLAIVGAGAYVLSILL